MPVWIEIIPIAADQNTVIIITKLQILWWGVCVLLISRIYCIGSRRILIADTGCFINRWVNGKCFVVVLNTYYALYCRIPGLLTFVWCRFLFCYHFDGGEAIVRRRSACFICILIAYLWKDEGQRQRSCEKKTYIDVLMITKR